MDPIFLLLIYCLAIVCGSLLGGWIPSLIRLTHRRLQFLISFVAGLMLGVSVLHLLPHSWFYTRNIDQSVMWMLGGLLGMFFLLRAFHFHHHGPVEGSLTPSPECDHGHDHDEAGHHHDHAGTHSHAHQHENHGSHPHGHQHGAAGAIPPFGPGSRHRLGWVGVAAGLSLHTAIDGIALAASIRAEASGHSGYLLFGLATFLVILLHKPLDALSITTLMAAGGWSFRSRQFVNLGFSMMCPLGAVLFYLGVGADQSEVIGCALALAAGSFLCISLGDLLPEVEFHTHDRLALSLLLMLGVGAAYGIGKLEHGMHDHGSHSHDHDHGDHDHEHGEPGGERSPGDTGHAHEGEPPHSHDHPH